MMSLKCLFSRFIIVTCKILKRNYIQIFLPNTPTGRQGSQPGSRIGSDGMPAQEREDRHRSGTSGANRSIPSMADGQGSALGPGSSPGAPMSGILPEEDRKP